MTHSPLPAFAATSGPRKARILLVGEAWGQSEFELKKPFVGESGKELFLMLGEAMPTVAPELHAEATAQFKYGLAWVRPREAWLESAGIAMTNVLAFRPPGNKIEALCASKSEVGGPSYELPHLSQGKYLRPEYLPELSRLFVEIGGFQPSLIVALGNTACWAILRATNIGSIRGTVTIMARGLVELRDTQDQPIKVLPTYHPAGVMRQWSWRTIVVSDLMKAAREAQFPEIRRPSRQVLVSPSIQQVEDWTRETLANPPALLAPLNRPDDAVAELQDASSPGASAARPCRPSRRRVHGHPRSTASGHTAP